MSRASPTISKLRHALGDACAWNRAVNTEHFAQRSAHRHAGIEGRVRILKYNLYKSPSCPQRTAVERSEIDTVKRHAATVRAL
jgi:hypothetical protein